MGRSESEIKIQVKNLIKKMTLEEKTAQLGALMMIDISDGSGIDPDKADRELKNGIGHISRTQWMMGDIEPALTGYQTKRAAAYPQSIGLASTWKPDWMWNCPKQRVSVPDY